MAVLLREFGLAPTWLEVTSNNTVENARLTQRTLRESGIERIYLVTHAWHMRRARIAFEDTGLQVIPAGTGYVIPLDARAVYLVPSAQALELSSAFFREVGGIAWYRLKSALGH
jgi:uncharacterized SAM-binding protein YcdF (DUF218 family)